MNRRGGVGIITLMRLSSLSATLRRCLLWSPTLVIALVGSAWVQPLPAFGVGGIGIRPLQPSGSEPGWFLYTLAPGESREDSVLVFNDSDRAQDLELSSVDSEVSAVGAFALRRTDEPQFGVGKWITLSQHRLTLAAGERREVKFALTLPADVDVGEHSGAVTVTATRTATSTASGIATQVGARVYVTVPGQQVRKLQIKSLTVVETEDRQGYDFTLTGANEGNATLTADARLRLEGVGMVNWITPFRPYDLPQQWQLPRGAEVSTHFRAIPKPMLGRLVAYATVQFDGESGREVVESPRRVLTIIPWPEVALALGAVLTLVGGVALAIVLRRRKTSGKGWGSHTVAAGDTITALAEAGGIAWQVLAKVNRLKPPYVLTSGQVVQVPPSVSKATVAPVVAPWAETTGPVDESAQLPEVSLAPGRRWLLGALFLGSGVVVAMALLAYVRSASQLPDANSAAFAPTATDDDRQRLSPPNATPPPVAPPTENPQDAAATSSSAASAVDRSTKVLVLNGSGVVGEAGRLAALLRAAGFTRVETGNADSFTYRGLVIRHHPGQRAVAEAVAGVFQAGAVEVSTDAAAPVVAIIGGPNQAAVGETPTTTPTER